MAKSKAKVKQHFSHQGKQYKPGDEFEGEDHDIQMLASQGHVEHPQGQQGQQGQGGKPGQDPKQSGGQQDPSKPGGHDPSQK